jgi:cell division protein FtsB
MSSRTTTQRGASRRSAPTAKTRKRSAPRRASSSRTPARAAARRAPARPAGRVIAIAVVAGILVLGWALYPALKLQYQTSRRVGGLEQQYQTLKKRNDALRAQVAELKTPAGVEQAARESLGYTKVGDHAYVVMPSAAPTQASGVAAASTVGDGRSLLQTVLDAIFGVAPAPSADSAP